jgi:hypothetical protein
MAGSCPQGGECPLRHSSPDEDWHALPERGLSEWDDEDEKPREHFSEIVARHLEKISDSKKSVNHRKELSTSVLLPCQDADHASPSEIFLPRFHSETRYPVKVSNTPPTVNTPLSQNDVGAGYEHGQETWHWAGDLSNLHLKEISKVSTNLFFTVTPL